MAITSPRSQGLIRPEPRQSLLGWLFAIVLGVRVVFDGQTGSGQVSSPINALCAGALLLIGVLYLLRRHRGVRFALILVAFLGISAGFGVATYGTAVFAEYLRTLSVFAVAIAVLNAPRTWTVARAILVLQLVGLIPAVVSIVQLLTHQGMEINGDLRAAGTFEHPNSAVVFFGIVAAGSLFQALTRSTLIRWAAVGLFSVSAVATFSVTGILTLTLMLLMVIVLHRQVRPAVKIALVVLAAIAAAIVAGLPEWSSRVAGILGTGDDLGTAYYSLQWRLHSWNYLLALVPESPVFGIGYGTTTTDTVLQGNIPHNEYVRVLVETGGVGLLLAIIGLVALLGRLFRRLKDDPDGPASLGLAVLIGLLLNAAAANTLLYSVASYAAAMLIASALIAPTSDQPNRLVTTRRVAR